MYAVVSSFGAALADEQEADALQQFYWRIHSFRQEEVGAGLALVNFYFSGEKNRWRFRGYFFYPFDEFGTIEARHDQVGEHQVNSALREPLQRLLRVVVSQYAVASGFQHYFSDG